MRLAIVLLLISQISLGMAKPSKCENTLKACEDVIQAQDKAIDNLKKSVIVLKQELEQEQKRTPGWVVLVGGIAIGVILNSTLRK